MTMEIDLSTILRDVTPDDVDAIVDAVRAMLDVKVAHWQLEGPAQVHVSAACASAAYAALSRLTVAGAVLFGDLGDAITGAREDVVPLAVARQEQHL